VGGPAEVGPSATRSATSASVSHARSGEPVAAATTTSSCPLAGPPRALNRCAVNAGQTPVRLGRTTSNVTKNENIKHRRCRRNDYYIIKTINRYETCYHSLAPITQPDTINTSTEHSFSFRLLLKTGQPRGFFSILHQSPASSCFSSILHMILLYVSLSIHLFCCRPPLRCPYTLTAFNNFLTQFSLSIRYTVHIQTRLRGQEVGLWLADFP